MSLKKLKPLLGKDKDRDEKFTSLQKQIENYIIGHKNNIIHLYKNMETKLRNRPGQILKPLVVIERFLGTKELLEDEYRKQINSNLIKNMRTDGSLIVLRTLYEHNGKMSLKELTKHYNRHKKTNKVKQYVGGILKRAGLEEYKETRAQGYTHVDIPTDVILETFEQHNINKELLDSMCGKVSEESDDSEEVLDTTSEESEDSEEPEEDEIDYIFDIIHNEAKTEVG